MEAGGGGGGGGVVIGLAIKDFSLIEFILSTLNIFIVNILYSYITSMF